MIDIQGLLAMLPHRAPFLMIDRVTEVDPGQRAVALKCVSINEPFFQGHFPGTPILPGVMLAEAFAQVAAVIALSGRPEFQGRPVYLLGMDGLRFRRPVIPGDQVVITCEKLWEKRNIWRFKAKAEVAGHGVAEGEIMATVADRLG